MVSDVSIPRTILNHKYNERYNLILICNEIDKEIKRIGIVA